MKRTEAAAGSAGFTLLELLIALVLTGVLSLVAYASLDLSIKAMHRGRQAGEDLQEIRVSQAILERSLSSTAAVAVDRHLYFVGDSREMRFFTQVPLEAHTLGGIYHWRIFSEQDSSRGGLLAVEQTRNLNWLRDPGGVEVRQILMDHLASVSFSYGRGEEGYTTWDAQKAGRLPEWVKITYTRKGHDPLVLLIPLYVAQAKIDPRAR